MLEVTVSFGMLSRCTCVNSPICSHCRNFLRFGYVKLSISVGIPLKSGTPLSMFVFCFIDLISGVNHFWFFPLII